MNNAADSRPAPRFARQKRLKPRKLIIRQPKNSRMANVSYSETGESQNRADTNLYGFGL
jgi:hypothetical protein